MYSQHVPTWMHQPRACDLPCPMTGARGGPWCDGHRLASAVYGPLAENSGFTAFAYLWRRFGPPWHGSDDYKDLGGYILSTPHPEVFLDIGLSGAGLEYSIGYLIPQTFEARLMKTDECVAWEHQFETWWLEHKLTEAEGTVLSQGLADEHPDKQAVVKHYWDDRLNRAIVREAEQTLGPYPGHAARDECPEIVENLMAALYELLRPTSVRDVYFNILGCVPDDYQDDKDTAPYSRYAGFGVPQDAMDALLAKERR
jgi:hypothetical protein